MLGLVWDDSDPINETLRICRQYSNDKVPRAPKSKMINRTIAISAQLSQYLDSWKKIQEKELALAGCIQNGDTPIAHP